MNEKKALLLKALTALYLEVDKSIADSIMEIAKDYINEVEQNLPPCNGEPCTCTPRVEKVEPK